MRLALIAKNVGDLILFNVCLGALEGFFFPEGGEVLGVSVWALSAIASILVGIAIFVRLAVEASPAIARNAVAAVFLYFTLVGLLRLLLAPIFGVPSIEVLVVDGALDVFAFSVGTVLGGVVACRSVSASTDA